MKSELYKVIYKMAIYCAAIAGFLSIAAGVVCYILHKNPAVTAAFWWIAIGICAFGVVLMILAIVIAIIFYRRYQKIIPAEQEDIKE